MNGTLINEKRVNMAASKIRIKKTCEWCGQEFYAQKITTMFCCKRCSEKSYKAGLRTAQIEHATNMLESRPQEEVSKMEYLSVRKASVLLDLPLRTTYDLIYSGKLKACKISSRMTLIRRCDIEEMVVGGSYNKSKRTSQPITEFYTTKEIKEKYGVSESWIFKVGKEKDIPKIFRMGKTLWSKGFTKKCQPNSRIGRLEIAHLVYETANSPLPDSVQRFNCEFSFFFSPENDDTINQGIDMLQCCTQICQTTRSGRLSHSIFLNIIEIMQLKSQDYI